MTISVQPVDGLINRLLQSSRSASASEKHLNYPIKKTRDQVSISARAQMHQQGSTSVSGQEKDLESHLLNLYKMNDSSGA